MTGYQDIKDRDLLRGIALLLTLAVGLGCLCQGEAVAQEVCDDGRENAAMRRVRQAAVAGGLECERLEGLEATRGLGGPLLSRLPYPQCRDPPPTSPQDARVALCMKCGRLDYRAQMLMTSDGLPLCRDCQRQPEPQR